MVPPPLHEEGLPDYLQIRVVVRGDKREVISEGRGPAALGLAAGVGDDPLAAARAMWQTPPTRSWPGPLPDDVRHAGHALIPIIVRDRDEQARVAVRRSVVRSPQAAQAWHADGVAALLEACFDDDLLAIAEAPGAPRGCQTALHAEPGAIRRALARAVLVADDLAAVRDEAAFDECRQRALTCLRKAVGGFDQLMSACIAGAEQLKRAMGEERGRWPRPRRCLR